MNRTKQNRAGITSVALAFPRRWMPNSYWQEHHPDMVKKAEESIFARIWKPKDGVEQGTKHLFSEAMMPYAKDPFRGVVHRRWLEPGQDPLSIELQAAKDALTAAKLSVEDIDLAIVGSLFPSQLTAGNAPFLAKELGLKGAAFNLETACSSSLVGLQTAMGLIDAGHYKRILLVNSCSYSRYMPERESISWSNGDGASAIVIQESESHGHWLGGHTLHSGSTCGALNVSTELENGEIVLRMRGNATTGKLLGDTAESFVREPVFNALKKSGVSLDEIDFFVCNTPVAWYRDFFCSVLGIGTENTISMHSDFANTAPVLMPSNLYYALERKLISPGDRVLLFSVGSVSSSSCAILQVGDIALGPKPAEIPVDLVPGGLIPDRKT